MSENSPANPSINFNWPEKLAVSSFLLYATLILIPGILWRIPAKWIISVSIVVISIVAIFFDKDVPTRSFANMMIRYACAGTLALFYGWIRGGAPFDWITHLSKGLLAWYPIVFVCYLKNKQNTKIRVLIKNALLAFIAFTCLTTLIHIRQNPEASRWLSSGLFESASPIRISLSKMNIGSYGFVYMLVLLIPVLIGIIGTSVNKRAKLLYSTAFLLCTVTVLFTQFLIAIYAMILCLGIMLISYLFKCVLNLLKLQLSLFTRMLCVLPVAFALFIMMLEPLNAGLNRMFVALDLGALTERIESISAVDKIEESQDLIGTSVSDSNDIADDESDLDYLLRDSSDPLVNRVLAYLRPIKTMSNNWLTGNLFSRNVITSSHSDIIDAVAGGGLLGSIAVVCLFIVMFLGLYSNLVNHELMPFIILSFLMCMGLALVNTIYYVREIFLVCLVMPVVGYAKPEPEPD